MPDVLFLCLYGARFFAYLINGWTQKDSKKRKLFSFYQRVLHTMYHKLSSISKLTQYPLFTQSTIAGIVNTSKKTVILNRQSKVRRWLLGMIIGSAPFLTILMCWMFVSVCIYNLFKLYQQRKASYRQNSRTSALRSSSSKINI